MYSIYANDICIYSDVSPLESVKLISPKLVLEDSAAGSLTMTLPVTNAGYNYIQRLVTDITVYRNNTEIWSGRVLTEDKDFFNNRALYCEGELAFLNDSSQPQAEYHDISVRQFLETMIGIHNQKVAANRRFTVGSVTVTEANNDNSLYRYTNYESTIECINEKLVKRLGGHLRVRKVNGVRYLDYLADYPNTNSQVIRFGTNLMDFTRKWDMTEFATVILPLGSRLEDSPMEPLESYYTVESVNGGSLYVQSASAVASYGWIEKTVHWDDVGFPSTLLQKARAYLSDMQFDSMTIELKALDLHYMDVNAESVKLLDQIRVVSSPHGMDRYFPVSKLEIPLDNPSNTVFTLGDTVKTSLTSVHNAANEKIYHTIDTKALDVLSSARANATAILNMATNGYITITHGENGTNELYISESQNLAQSSKYWKFGMNGFGYTNNGGRTYKVAITMDGQIVADFITTGTLEGSLIKAGSIQASSISVEYRNSVNNSIISVRTDLSSKIATLRSTLEQSYSTTTVMRSEITQKASEITASVAETYATKSQLTLATDSITTEVNKKVNGTDFGTYLKQNYNSFILGFNDNSRILQLNTAGISIYDQGISNVKRLIRFNQNGMEVWRAGLKLGRIGTNNWTGYSTYRGLVFDLDYDGKYMAWARKVSADSTEYTTVLTYARRQDGIFANEGLYFGCNVYAQGYEIHDAHFVNCTFS